MLASFILTASAVVGQTADDLYAKAFSAYTNYHWKDAVNYLSSYLNYNPRPANLANPAFLAEVDSAYNFAAAQYNLSLQKPVPSDNGIGNTVAGLSARPPRLRKPKVPVTLMAHNFRPDVSGRWVLKIYHTNGQAYSCALILTQNGTNITGTLGIVSGTDMSIVGTIEGDVLTFACVDNQTTQSYALTTTDFKYFSGSFNYEGNSPDFGALSMTRRQ